MKYLKQLLFDMRHQKMMTWISISGTAVSIFLLLVYYMVNSIPTVDMAPETHRDRIYQGYGMHIIQHIGKGEREGGGGLSYETAQRFYEGLPGVEKTAYASHETNTIILKEKGKIPNVFSSIAVDGKYWDMFKFKFIEGKPFTEDDCLSTTENKIVISESVARKMFGSTDIVGRELTTEGKVYVVSGVVENVNPLLVNTSYDLYVPMTPALRESWSPDDEAFRSRGSVKVFLQYGPDADPEVIANHVKSRYATLNSHLKDFDTEAIYHGSPYSTEEMAAGVNAYSDKEVVKKDKWMQYIVYLLLLILPALNLSGMVRGRLEKRISEIGVRRAFGARRSEIVRQLLGENLVVTIVGGVIGLVASLLFMKFLSAQFFTIGHWWARSGALALTNPDMGMLLKWPTFFIALGICFILNILTATIPAWKASRIMPAEAIAKSKI